MSEIFAAIVGGIFAVLGVLVGARISQRNAYELDSRRILADSYAELFSAYCACIPNTDQENIIKLVAAIEKVKLFCSSDSEMLLEELLLAITEDRISFKKCGDCILRLHQSAKEEMSQRKRK